MKQFNLLLTEEEIKIIGSALEAHKQDLVRGLKRDTSNSPTITLIVRNAFEEASKIQAYFKYKLNESEKEAKEYERL